MPDASEKNRVESSLEQITLKTIYGLLCQWNETLQSEELGWMILNMQLNGGPKQKT